MTDTGNLFGVVDLGGTKIYSAILDGAGNVLGEDLRPTDDALGPDAVISRIVDSLRGAAESAGAAKRTLSAAGIAAPGPVDTAGGRLLHPPNLAGWGEVALGSILAGHMHCRVVVENDANAAAMGEYMQGSGRGARALVYVTVSTGIGGGIILDGRLHRGTGGAAGEIGHMVVRQDGPRCACGRRGCLEAVASGTAIARDGRMAVEAGRAPLLRSLVDNNVEAIAAETVAEAAHRGDSAAETIIREAGVALGLGLAGIVNLLNPDLLVLGGGIVKIGDRFLRPAEETLREAIFARPARGVELRLASLEYPAVAGMKALLSS